MKRKNANDFDQERLDIYDHYAHIYPGVNHGFHNDTTPRYDKAAAELAWKRTITFFGQNLA